MRYFFKITLSMLALAWLAGCAALAPQPKTINLSQERLFQLISSQFPFNNRMLEVLEVAVSKPRVQLDPQNNRIQTGLDVNVAPRGLAGALTQRNFSGVLDMSYGLRFEPSDNSIRMADVKVSKLDVPGVPEQFQVAVNKLGGLLAEKLLSDYSLYKLTAADLQSEVKGWGYKPGKFSIANNGLNIAIDPVATK
jgi:hypothetical protein